MSARRVVGVAAMLLSPSLSLSLAVAGCGPSRDDLTQLMRNPVATAREQRLEGAKAEHVTSMSRGAPLAVWHLPRELHEISGIALTSDGNLLAHGDELAEVWSVDPRRGILLKQFSVGKPAVKGDFEGIAIANDDVYLLSSKGRLYKFHEGKDGSHQNYEEFDTGLEKACEFEGIAFDPSINALVLACKHVYDRSLQNMVVLYRLNLADNPARTFTRMTVSVADIIGTHGWKELKPSDITVDPFTGNYVLLASAEKALLVIKPDGTPVSAQPLPPNHYQPEGVAISKDSLLMISDEGGGVPGMITLYRWP